MITVNAMGDNCPIPVIKTKKAMDALTGPETIEVLVDNEIAVQNVTKMATSAGGKVTSEQKAEKEYVVILDFIGNYNNNFMLLRSRWKEHQQQRMMQRTTIQLL